MNHVLRHLRRAALLTAGEGPSDTQLLDAFLVRRDEAAFEALLRRHGPMVLGVCRRVLRNWHDAEDAFQATFLVLARQAASIRTRHVVASWLYGVAYRTAMKARAMNAKRRAKERQASEMAPSEASEDGANEELLARLDHELSRLPGKYRVPVVLCELEGKSRKEVARLLGVPEGTLSSRLAYAKKLLSTRLSRRGVTLSVGAFAAVLSPTLRASTLKTVFSVEAVSTNVLALTEGMMKAMFLSKLKITACATALMLVAGVGATGLTYRATAEQPALTSRPQADELEALRLEIEALRKSLQATRERMKTLEGEVSALKQQPRGPRGMAQGGGAMPGKGGGIRGGGSQSGTPQSASGGTQGVNASHPASGSPPSTSGESLPSSAGPQQQAPGGGMPQGMMGRMGGGLRGSTGMGGSMRRGTSDPLGEAEAALKKLRENPGDTKATETLERALKKLKEQKKPEVPGQGNRQ
jgi:RNA polymerase sigma factor (sigma-70 family)